jgi:hypothetical protein
MPLTNVFKVMFTSNNVAIEAGADMTCYAQNPNPGNPNQQWQLIYYPEKNAVAMLIAVNNVVYALSALPDVKYPKLQPFVWDDSYLWRVSPLDGNEGVPTVRDGDFCLTWENGSNKPGTRLQYYKWRGESFQRFTIARIPG